MGRIRDTIYRKPERTLMPGIGIASAVLAGMIVAISLAAGLIGFDSGHVDIPTHPSTAQRIARLPVTVADPPARERVASRVRVRAARRAATSTVTSRRAAVVKVDESTSAKPPAPTPPPPPPAVTPPPPAAKPAPKPLAPLEPVGTALNDTTDDLAGTVRGLTKNLGGGVAGVSPPLGTVVTQTGDALGDILAGTGNVLGQTLGGPRR